MDNVTRCIRCGKRTVSTIQSNGRTELKCIRCVPIDPLKPPLERAEGSEAPK